MVVRDISFDSPEKNILFDEHLLALAERGETGETLRFWETKIPFIVLGKTSVIHDDVFLDNAQKDGIQIIRRSSGGGTVIQAPGCLNYTLILSKASHGSLGEISSSYRYILERISASLQQHKIESMFFPPCDLATKKGKRKFSGNAQRRLKKYILHHGTILYDFDFSLAEKYLTIPKKIPFYRDGRSHIDFLTNIGLEKSVIKKSLIQSFDAIFEQ